MGGGAPMAQDETADDADDEPDTSTGTVTDAGRVRDEQGRYAEKIPVDELLAAVRRAADPVVTIGELAKRFDCTNEAVLMKLQDLHDQGLVARRSVSSRAVVWWAPDDRDENVETGESDAELTPLTLGDYAAGDRIRDVIEDAENPHTQVKLSDVYDAVRQAVREGDPITTAPALAEEMYCSDDTVRDRLKRLEALGLVTSKTVHGSGVKVWWPVADPDLDG